VDGHSHHDLQKRDLQVSNKGCLTHSMGIKQAKREAILSDKKIKIFKHVVAFQKIGLLFKFDKF
jgi:hypothetical protein